MNEVERWWRVRRDGKATVWTDEDAGERIAAGRAPAWEGATVAGPFILEQPERDTARCQHCPCLADERSFMCEDCASKADTEVQTLRDVLEDVRRILDRDDDHIDGYLDAIERAVNGALGAHPEMEEPGALALPRTEAAICGRLLVGQGGDTYDPTCVLLAGHDDVCKPETEAPDA